MEETLALATQPSLSALVAAYLAGLATCLTPCVYPLVPVTLAIFGARADTSRMRTFSLSVCYVAGICLTFTALGLFAAKTGAVFGSFLGSTPVLLSLASIFILLALYTLEVIHLPFVATLQSKANRIGGKGFGGAFFMGVAAGVVAAPCVGPPLILILGVAAGSSNTWWGAALLFTYALGFGTLFILLGTFSGLLNRLPRAGGWMSAVKFVIASALFLTAFFLLSPLMARYLSFLSVERFFFPLVITGVFCLALAFLGYRFGSKPLQVFCSLGLGFCVYQALLSPAPAHESRWIGDLEHALSTAKERDTLVMLDLYADWCAACKELEKITFVDPKVEKMLAEFVLARLDFTLMDETAEEVSDRFDIVGLPAVLFLTPAGQELAETRISGFVTPEEFLQILEKVRTTDKSKSEQGGL